MYASCFVGLGLCFCLLVELIQILNHSFTTLHWFTCQNPPPPNHHHQLHLSHKRAGDLPLNILVKKIKASVHEEGQGGKQVVNLSHEQSQYKITASWQREAVWIEEIVDLIVYLRHVLSTRKEKEKSPGLLRLDRGYGCSVVPGLQLHESSFFSWYFWREVGDLYRVSQKNVPIEQNHNQNWALFG